MCIISHPFVIAVTMRPNMKSFPDQEPIFSYTLLIFSLNPQKNRQWNFRHM